MTHRKDGNIIKNGKPTSRSEREKRTKEMIAKFSVKKPYTVLVGVVLAIILGVVSFTR